MNLTLGENELPVRLRFERRMTDAELVAFCASNEPFQVERDANGEIVILSPTYSDGGSMEVDIAAELILWARADGRGKVFGPSAGFTLPDSMRSPDASWIRWERWNALTELERKHSFAPICPEFVIELRSETDRLNTLLEKMQMWIGNGAELAWLIDPTRKAVEVYRPGQETEFYKNPSSVVGCGPVQGFELVMDRVWGTS